MARMHHFGVVQTETAFVDHAALEVLHDRFVEILFYEPLFENGTDPAERTIVPADKFLVNEHISDVIIHKIPPLVKMVCRNDCVQIHYNVKKAEKEVFLKKRQMSIAKRAELRYNRKKKERGC